MDLLSFPGAARVLDRHAAALPQPDQLCGPFATHLALHAVLDDPPGTTELAIAAGTRVWPADVAGWRPPGAPWDRTGWDRLPEAPDVDHSGTDAAGVVAGLGAVTDVDVVPVPARRLGRDPLASLVAALLDPAETGPGGPVGPVGVVANVRTGALDPRAGFDVGHFVVLWGASPDGAVVGIADTYAELGAPGEPPGCRRVTVEALHRGVAAPPGRGLLLLAGPGRGPALVELLGRLGVPTGEWSA